MATNAIITEFTAAQHAAFNASPYGRYGGGRRFIADLAAGTVHRLDAPDDSSGYHAKYFTASSDATHAAVKALAAANQQTIKEFVRTALFGGDSRALTLRLPLEADARLRKTAAALGREPEQVASMLLSSASSRATEFAVLLVTSAAEERS